MKNMFMCFFSLHDAPMDLHEMITYIKQEKKNTIPYLIKIKHFVFASWKITYNKQLRYSEICRTYLKTVWLSTGVKINT